MLLKWDAVKNHDFVGNTRYVAASAGRPELVYRVEPALRNDQVRYSIGGTSPGLLGDDLPPPIYPTLAAAQQACEDIEVRLTDHVVTAREVILDWAAKNPNVNYIEHQRLHRSGDRLPYEAIEAQLLEWVRAGKLVPCFIVKGRSSLGSAKSGRFFWDTVDKIPKVLRDTGDDLFRADDGDILPAYRRPDSKAIAAEGGGF